jgi:endonuclease/exonuclease/phosphatase family metal-dependent hydrolase
MSFLTMQQIADRMDTDFPATSLKALLQQHRNTFEGGISRRPHSLRNLCQRHDGPETISIFFQNTYLLTAGEIKIGCQYPWPIPDTFPITITASKKPAIDERAPLFGQKLAEARYDIVALSEIFSDSVLDKLTDAWLKVDGLSRREQGPSALGIPDLPLPLPVPTCPPVPTPGGPVFGVPILRGELGNSGLVTLIRRHPVIDVAKHRFTNTGSPTKDIDFFSSKGVLKVTVNIGVGVISVFSTHLYNGGDSIELPTEAHRDAVKLSQFKEIRDMVLAEQHQHPDRLCVVGGDFNRDGTVLIEPRYTALMALMQEANLADAWADRARKPNGDVIPGVTDIPEDNQTNTRVRCSAGPDPDLDPTHCKEEGSQAGGGKRIDYIFVQRPASTHTFDIDFQRPRRVVFELPTPTADGGLRYLSDHLGLEIQIFARARS